MGTTYNKNNQKQIVNNPGSSRPAADQKPPAAAPQDLRSQRKERIMRNTKKAISILLTLLMVVGMMSTFAFADTKVNITIDNAKEGTYTAYKIFDATYSGTENAGYTISSTSPLLDAIKNIKVSEASGAASYFTIEDKVGDTTKKIVTVNNRDALTGEQLAGKLKSAIDSLSSENKTKLDSFEGTTTNGKATISVDPGYYYITTSTGSVVVATANAKNIEIKDKTSQPGSMIKTIKYVDGVNVNKDKASAEVGDVVAFEVTLNATNYQKNESNVPQKVTSYTIRDTITGNMKLDGEINVSFDPVLPKGHSVVSTIDKASDNKSFTINITGWNSVDDGIDRTIKVTYSAKVTGVGTATNTANYFTNVITTPPVNPPTTEIYTYSVIINKIDKEKRTALTGAQFEVYTSETSGSAIQFVKNSDGTYTVANDEQLNNTEITKTTVIDMSEVSSATFNGLKNGTYYLQEIKAPDGYNLLKGRVGVTLKNYVNPKDPSSGEIAETSATIANVENSTGTELPSTGGIGTTIFYLIGAILVIGAGVVFVTRRRMHSGK